MYQTDLNYDTVWQKKKKPALCSVTGVATEIVTPKDKRRVVMPSPCTLLQCLKEKSEWKPVETNENTFPQR